MSASPDSAFTAVLWFLCGTAVIAVAGTRLALAVSDIVGGNALDVLFVAAADLACVDGSIFASAGPAAVFLTALAV